MVSGDDTSLDRTSPPVEIALGPTTVRGLALSAIAAAAAPVVLREAAPVVVPVLVSVLLAYALEPFVARFRRWGLPRPAAAGVVYLLLGAATVVGAREVGGRAQGFLDDLPDTIAAAQKSLSTGAADGPNAMDRLQEAAKTIEHATATTAPHPPPGVSRVTIVGPTFDVRAYLVTIMHGLLGTGIQLVIVGVLTFLILATGDLYKRKLVNLAGVSLTDRKITIELLESIDRQIERYLLVRVLISAIVATGTGVALYWLGVGHALVWGLVAGTLNVLPLVGPTAAVVLIAVAAFLQFQSVAMAAAAGGAALVVAAVEGNLITPLLVSRAGELNTVAVFVSVLAWGWMWDVWGLLLAVPIMVAVKAAADHIESLKPVGELLGR